MYFIRKNNPMMSMFFTAVLFVAITQTHVLADDAGGNSGGGGHMIETGFKNKVLASSKALTQLSAKARQQLKFDADRMDTTLNMPGRFFALCATGSELQRVRSEQKMARVFEERPNTVYLNCADYSLTDWKKAFDSKDEKDQSFFVHEGLRLVPEENVNENDLSKSSSIKSALREHSKFVKEVVFELVYSGKKSKCKVELDFVAGFSGGQDNSSTFHIYSVNFLVKDKLVLSFQTARGNDERSYNTILSEVMSETGTARYRGNSTRGVFDIHDLLGANELFKLATDYNCYEDNSIKLPYAEIPSMSTPSNLDQSKVSQSTDKTGSAFGEKPSDPYRRESTARTAH